MKDDLRQLLEIVRTKQQSLIGDWQDFFEISEREREARYYDDFLGFFEDCIIDDLDVTSDSAQAMTIFLRKILENVGEDYFFNFKNSVYTCFLKFPIFRALDAVDGFHYGTAKPLTAFFESLTSRIIFDVLITKRDAQFAAEFELGEREAPVSEIWDDILMVTIVGTLDSNRILSIIDKVLIQLEKGNMHHVIIDINTIIDMNSEIANQLIKLSGAIHFMGVKAYISGINPTIAKKLTHLALNLGEIKTFRSTKDAMRHILG